MSIIMQLNKTNHSLSEITEKSKQKTTHITSVGLLYTLHVKHQIFDIGWILTASPQCISVFLKVLRQWNQEWNGTQKTQVLLLVQPSWILRAGFSNYMRWESDYTGGWSIEMMFMPPPEHVQVWAWTCIEGLTSFWRFTFPSLEQSCLRKTCIAALSPTPNDHTLMCTCLNWKDCVCIGEVLPEHIKLMFTQICNNKCFQTNFYQNRWLLQGKLWTHRPAAELQQKLNQRSFNF